MSSSNNVQSKRNNITANYFKNLDIITTPFEKVLSIINEAKNYIEKVSNKKNKLILDLQWTLKVIASHSLYTYVLKEKDLIHKLSKENREFKEYVQFVSDYNEKVIEMNKKINYMSDELLQKSSLKLKRYKIVRKNSVPSNNPPNSDDIFGKVAPNKCFSSNKIIKISHINNMSKFKNFESDKQVIKNVDMSKYKTVESNNLEKINNENHNINDENVSIKAIKYVTSKTNNKVMQSNQCKKNNINSSSAIKPLSNKFSFFSAKKLNSPHKYQKILIRNNNLINENEKKAVPYIKIDININNSNNKIINNNNINNRQPLNSFSSQLISKKDFDKSPTNNNTTFNNNLFNSYISELNISKIFKVKSPKLEPKKLDSLSKKNLQKQEKNYSFSKLENILIYKGYDYKQILDKNFNIFEFRDIIGRKNVLPFIGRFLLDSFGLIDEEIMSIKKLDIFLTTLNSQYLTKPLYHTCMHAADVTHSLSLYFLNTNAEKICQTKVLDLLGILIAAMGHDLGHPGLTNNFLINASTDMAITYNDISCLENYHSSKLFSILKNDATNIFDKLNPQEYKLIRKRMISEILATDMANHVKVMTVLQPNIYECENNINNKEFKLSGNEKTKFDEQQSLLDFFIHSADLGHNTKLFNISLQWVELLSEEFWRQGDLEKELNLPVSFLCDRENTDVPNSQKGFINGFIKPTLDILISIFPTLKFLLNNANENLVEWQKLIDQNRKKGWTPIKKSKAKKIRLNSFVPIGLNKSENNENLSNNNNKKIISLKNKIIDKTETKSYLFSSPLKKSNDEWKIEKMISPLVEKGRNPFIVDEDLIKKGNLIRLDWKKNLINKQKKICK